MHDRKGDIKSLSLAANQIAHEYRFSVFSSEVLKNCLIHRGALFLYVEQ